MRAWWPRPEAAPTPWCGWTELRGPGRTGTASADDPVDRVQLTLAQAQGHRSRGIGDRRRPPRAGDRDHVIAQRELPGQHHPLGADPMGLGDLCDLRESSSEPAGTTPGAAQDRKSTRLNSSHVAISYAV